MMTKIQMKMMKFNDEQDVDSDDSDDSQSEESNLVDDDDDDYDNDIVVFKKQERVDKHGVMLCYEKNRMSSSNKQVKP